jgi:hypothetical protein
MQSKLSRKISDWTVALLGVVLKQPGILSFHILVESPHCTIVEFEIIAIFGFGV